MLTLTELMLPLAPSASAVFERSARETRMKAAKRNWFQPATWPEATDQMLEKESYPLISSGLFFPPMSAMFHSCRVKEVGEFAR